MKLDLWTSETMGVRHDTTCSKFNNWIENNALLTSVFQDPNSSGSGDAPPAHEKVQDWTELCVIWLGDASSRKEE